MKIHFKRIYICLRNNCFSYKEVFNLFCLPLILVIFLFFLHQNGFTERLLFKDITYVYDIPVYAGFFNYLGIFLWASVFSICIFTRSLLLKNKKKNQLNISFYNYACILNFIFLVDDQFSLHEKLGSTISEFFIYVAYFLLICLMLSKLKKIILKKEIIYFLAALSLFIASSIIDINFLSTQEVWRGRISLLEDIFKFIGIYYWLIFFGNLSLRIISESDRE